MQKNKDNLIEEFIKMRGYYFHFSEEEIDVFNKKYKTHCLYKYVVDSLDTSFRDIFQTAEIEVDKYLKESLNN